MRFGRGDFKIMKKACIVQIPPSRYNLSDYPENMLQCGYIEAIAQKNGLTRHFEFKTPSADILNLAGDKLLLDKVRNINPDILILPALSDCNYYRSVYLARKLKQIKPELKVVASGQEISRNTADMLASSPIDAGACFLFTEQTLIGLLRGILKKNNDFKNIDGIFFREKNGGKIRFTRPLSLYNNIRGIPSPYLRGVLKPAERVYLETKRGCYDECSYCSLGDKIVGGLSYRNINEIKKELLFLKKHGVKYITIPDFTFNYPPGWFKKITDLILKINKDKKLFFEGSARGDLIAPEQAKIFKECNFYNLGIGLQTINPRALKINRRNMNLKNWLKGVNALRQNGVGVTIDIIAGLAGDNLPFFKRTVDFLTENELNRSTECFALIVDPSSSFWKKAVSSGVKFQKTPPHLFLGSKTFSFNDIKKALNYAREKGCRIALESFCADEPAQLASPPAEEKNLPITKLIIDLDKNGSDENIFRFCEKIKRRIANTMTIRFKSENLRPRAKLMKKILAALSEPNPYTVWNIVLESKNPADKKLLGDLEKSVIYLPNNLDYEGIYLAEEPDKEYYRAAARFYAVY